MKRIEKGKKSENQTPHIWRITTHIKPLQKRTRPAREVVLQIGPVLRGTSIRDALPTVSFDQFVNQIQYADVAGKTLITPTGDRVKVGDLVRMETVPVKGSVIRENQRYTIYLSWEYVGTDKMRRAYIQQIIDGLDLPYGYSADEGRQEFLSEEEQEELTLMAVLAAAEKIPPALISSSPI